MADIGTLTLKADTAELEETMRLIAILASNAEKAMGRLNAAILKYNELTSKQLEPVLELKDEKDAG